MKQTITKLSVLALSALATLILPSFGAFAASITTNTTINGSVGSAITITTNGSVALSVIPNSGALMSTTSDTVTVNTNNTAGYSLLLSMTGATNVLNGPAGNTIAPAVGSLAVPATLAANQWGYRIDNYSNFGVATTTVVNSVPTSGTWAKVPVLLSAETIKNRNGTATNDITTVWYAMNIDASKPTGSYTNTVVYTATTN